VKPTDPDHLHLLAAPKDPGTKILRTSFHRFDGIAVLIERWNFDGICGSSAILLADQIPNMDDAAIRECLQKAGFDLGGSTTVVRNGDFVFVNFGFESA